MNYKKPAFWIIIAAIVACFMAVICFFTNPSNSSGALPNIHSHAYVVDEVTYESGMYSFTVVAGEDSPIYVINEDMTLASLNKDGEESNWEQLGKLEETILTKENFEDLFKDPGFWTEKVNAKSIRQNTVNAWRLVHKHEVLYYVLQQKNGDLYLAYGYQAPDQKADPGSFYEHIRWLFKLSIDTTGMSGMVAKSGDSAVPMLSFPKGTMIKDYVGSIYWLTINPGNDDFVPFAVWKDGEEIRGTYTAYDAVTFEPLKHFIPSGLDPQTYLFQNADPTRGYIVLATFSTEPDAAIYAFGARFNGYDADNSKLSTLVNEIANNPDCAASSNPFTYIEARNAEYNEILSYGSSAVDFFVEQIRAGENGLQGYIMAVACADITGIGDKDLGADWATAQEWLALYDKEETAHNHTPAEKRQAGSFFLHAEEQAEITDYSICYEEPDGCITSIVPMGHDEQQFMILNDLIYFIEINGETKIYAVDFSGKVQKECVLNEHFYYGCILYSDDKYIYGAFGGASSNANYIFQADWNLTECKQIDAFPKQFRQFDYKKVGKDFAELCQADISKIYVHGANVLFDANGMAYEMFLKVSAVTDSETICGNLLLKWYNQLPAYDTWDMNPWFNKVDEGYGSTAGLMSLSEFLIQLKAMEDTSVVPDNLPSGTKPFRLTYGTGTPEELPIAENARKVYIDLSNGTPNTIAEPDTSKDYLYIVSKDDNAITSILYVLAN